WLAVAGRRGGGAVLGFVRDGAVAGLDALAVEGAAADDEQLDDALDLLDVALDDLVRLAAGALEVDRLAVVDLAAERQRERDEVGRDGPVGGADELRQGLGVV